MTPAERTEALRALKEAGLTFGEIMRVFGEVKETLPHAVACEDRYGSDELEVDDRTILSEADGGAWVLCWRWITHEEAGVTPGDEDEDDEAEEGEDEA